MEKQKYERSVIKYVGGKYQLLDQLVPRLPKNFKKYHEPFFGGGALFFATRETILSGKECYLSDLNKELMLFWLTVRYEVEKLIEYTKPIQRSRETFIEIREMDRNPDFEETEILIRAARFLYLNKTAFNGLYRVNSKNFCNSSYGGDTKTLIVDENRLRKASELLQGKVIPAFQPFQVSLNMCDSRDFVYLDPPYVPESQTSDFTTYTKDGFGVKHQEKLFEHCQELDQNGVFWMLSNSNTEWVKKRYKDFKIEVVDAHRKINRTGRGDTKTTEVIIRNYE